MPRPSQHLERTHVSAVDGESRSCLKLYNLADKHESTILAFGARIVVDDVDGGGSSGVTQKPMLPIILDHL